MGEIIALVPALQKLGQGSSEWNHVGRSSASEELKMATRQAGRELLPSSGHMVLLQAESGQGG